MATYPDGIWSAPSRGTNMSDATTQTDILDAQNAEIIAMQNELGIQPSGSSLTVKARLDAFVTSVADDIEIVHNEAL